MPESNSLYVGNLPLTFNDRDFRKLFSHFGKIDSMKLLQRDNVRGGQNKYGFVTFEEAENANEALKQLNKKTVKEHEIRVTFARSANDLVIKTKGSKPFKKNKKKRNFESLSSTKTVNAKTFGNDKKRRKVSSKKGNDSNENENVKKSEKKVPPSRIVHISNIPKSVSFDLLQQKLSDHQYLIYPSNESKQFNHAWILHKDVESAKKSIENLDNEWLNGEINAKFARKLSKMYRVKMRDANNKNLNKIKAFLNEYFNKHYKFEQEETKKSEKFKKYVRNRTLKKKKNKKYDVIQNVIVVSVNCTIIEFKKPDYALFAVQNMNKVKFESNSISFQYELEKYSLANKQRQKQQKKDKKEESVEPMEVDSNENVNCKDNIIKMFGIAKSVQFEQLSELIESIIGDKCNLIIYPAPDSLPNSQTAWICVKDDIKGIIGQKLIRKLNKTQINDESVGVIRANEYIQPQKIMIRNLSDSVKKNDLFNILSKYGRIKTIQMKAKNNSKSEHCGFCFVVFESVISASKAIKEMNGSTLHNKMMAIDYSLPKDIYDKIQKEWRQHQNKNKQKNVDIATNPFLSAAVTSNKEKNEPIWKLYSFMSDYQSKSFYKKYIQKNKKKKIKTFTENLCIEISSEPEDYDWLKWFLRKNRLNIIQYETNCKITIDVKAANIEIISDNERDLQKGTTIISEMLKNKSIREIGYTQIMNIPFEAEHDDFDWILYLNGENYAKRKDFELQTGCSFTFKGKLSSFLLKNSSDLLKVQLIGATKQSLQRGAHFMKDEMLSNDIKNERVKTMDYKCIHREYFPEKNKFEFDIDFIALIRSPNGQRLKNIEEETQCKIRVFGSNFENKKKIKSYCKILAKNNADLKKGCKVIHDLIHNDEIRAKALKENNDLFYRKSKNGQEKEKRFWFYAGDANEGRTIFVRNLPYEISKKEIMEKFDEFGRIIDVKIVYDKITGNCRGSCFVQFDSQQSVEHVLNGNVDISINGRKLLIDIAVDKNTANRIERKQLNNKDKRNLYLAKEGIIVSKEQMDQMDEREMNRRIEAWKEKKTKLANPNYHVSKTRLSVRNIPGFVNEKLLKKVFFEKAGKIRKEFAEDKTKKNDIFEYKFPKINQVKVVRDNDRLNDKGIGRSKRFGFVEFREHSDALLTLRSLNNQLCSEVFGTKTTKGEKSNKKSGRLTIEFSVEDMKKLWIHNQKTKSHQKKWKHQNLEQLKDKLEIHKAQNQEEEVKIVETKIAKIKQSFEEEQMYKKKQKKQILKTMKRAKTNFYDKRGVKNKKRGIKKA